MTDQRTPGNEDKRGFKALTSLVSDLNDLSLSEEQEGPSPRSSASAPRAEQVEYPQQQESPLHRTSRERPRPSGTARPDPKESHIGIGVLVLAGLFVLIFVLVSIGDQGTSPASSTPAARSPTPQAPSDPRFESFAQPTPTRPQSSVDPRVEALLEGVEVTPSRPGADQVAPPPLAEEPPPLGQNRLLSASEILYCLSEDVRLDAARSRLDRTDQLQVVRFNLMISAFNGRCANFRYRDDDMRSAEEALSRIRSSLVVEGGLRFTERDGPADAGIPPARRPEPSPVQGTSSGGSDGVPANASLSSFGSGWSCNRGFRREGDSCVAVEVPANARLDVFGSGWECDRGFRRAGNSCVAVEVPANARLDVFGSGWECNRGFRRVNNECIPNTR